MSPPKRKSKAGAWDKSTIIYKQRLTRRGIPEEAHEYMLGSRSVIEWVLDDGAHRKSPA
ncbi:type ISP restriction/modification enzyme [Cryobacterium zongtaii]|uniref:type ISP restriction/modification enzyme n=1 Tax=Cryobacterium zongtaii TaxID=1259217 RepID=UPI0013FD9517|nr:type ISP restriction/modification enzyme [Cryobacterium zongtaii]